LIICILCIGADLARQQDYLFYLNRLNSLLSSSLFAFIKKSYKLRKFARDRNKKPKKL